MSKFLLILRDDPSQFSDTSPAEFQAMIEKYQTWAAGLAARGVQFEGNKLTDGAGRVVRQAQGSDPVLRDGPYAETKEVVGGYYVIEAPDYAAACELLLNHPHLVMVGGSIEVREIEELAS